MVEQEPPRYKDYFNKTREEVGEEEYDRWIYGESGLMVRRTMTTEEAIADFLRNEGSQTEEWPNFGELIRPLRD
jgi:hypothetical protein